MAAKGPSTQGEVNAPWPRYFPLYKLQKSLQANAWGSQTSRVGWLQPYPILYSRNWRVARYWTVYGTVFHIYNQAFLYRLEFNSKLIRFLIESLFRIENQGRRYQEKMKILQKKVSCNLNTYFNKYMKHICFSCPTFGAFSTKSEICFWNFPKYSAFSSKVKFLKITHLAAKVIFAFEI